MIGLNESFPAGPVAKSPLPPLPAAVRAVFRAGGHLEARLGLEHRPGQARMAERVLEAFAAGRPLLCEAGTGIGKSLAYLVPGLLFAVAKGRPLVVSTHTIALQEQIECKDLALCRRLFEAVPELRPCAGFRPALLLGRGNYLCGTRLQLALRNRSELFPSAEQLELERTAAWAMTTATGLRQELSPEPLPEVWDWVQADAHACNPRNCTPGTCFFRKAREAVREAHLIIVNHSLLFALLAAGHYPRETTPGILFPEDFMVIDEAHTLPAVATEHFGRHLSALGLRRLLRKLHHPQRRKPHGLLARNGDPALRNEVTALTIAATGFFQSLHAAFLQSGRPFRLRAPDWHPNPLDVPLRDLIQGLAKVENRLPKSPERDELTGVRLSLQAWREGLAECMQLADPEAVYWLEPGGRAGDQVRLRSAPLEVAGPLRRRLFERNTGIVLTSATMAEGPSMNSFQAKVGAPGAPAIRVPSPFDYPLQMAILIHAGAPEPGDEGALDAGFIARETWRFANELAGGSLVLFTSYRDLDAVAVRLDRLCAAAGRPLLCQGSGTSRFGLLASMLDLGNAILLGTDSFWTGVDLPGAALSQVIITRLPFENPTHPVAEARAERCRRQGRSPFTELTLPAALVKFRQGIGRLIRSHTDEGRLVILDSRILTKPYGSLFLEVLPHPHYRRVQ